MNKISRLLMLGCSLLFVSPAPAQSIFDLPELLLQGSQSSRSPKLDYNIEFQYYLDNGNYKPGYEIFNSNHLYNTGRLTPSVSLSLMQDRGTAHRITVGIDLIKNMGEYPLSYAQYRDSEMDSKIANTGMLKEILFYYNFKKTFRNGDFNLHAGVFPRSVRQGEYSRAQYSDEDAVFDPNIDGISFKYDGKVTFAELGFDRTGYKGYDRREGYHAYTAGTVAPWNWAAFGWSGTYTYAGPAVFYAGKMESLIANAYLKFDFGQQLNMDRLSFKAGVLAGYHMDKSLEDASALFPVGMEAVANVSKWGFGVENTYYYGDNMMPLYPNDEYYTKSVASEVYKGDVMYFTHRGFPAFYDRLELYYQPAGTRGMDFRISAIGHFVTPNDEIKSLVGWQAKASLIFNLEKFNTDANRPKATRTRATGKASSGKSKEGTRNI